MTREDLIRLSPVFEAIKAGKNVQIYDTSNLSFHTRGWWKTVDKWGFGFALLSDFRIKNEDGTLEYFCDLDSKELKYRIHRDLDEPEKWVKNIEHYYN